MIPISSDSMQPQNSSGTAWWCLWQGLLAISHYMLLVLSLWYCKLVIWDAAEACYVSPCYEGPGLEELWKVNKGLTFTGESSGVFALLHAAVGSFLFAFSSSRQDSLIQDAHFVVGVFGGSTLCASLLSLNMVFVWGAETNLLINLSKLSANNKVFEESGRYMTVNHSLTEIFLELSSLSSGLCFLQLLILFQLVAANKEFTRYFRLLSTKNDGIGDAFVMTPNGIFIDNNHNDSETMPLRAPDGAIFV